MINYKFKIDLEGEREVYKNIVFTIGDKSGYRFDFVFYSNGKKIDASLYGLTVKAKRADGAVIIDSGITTEDGAYYVVADNAYSVKGELEFEVALVKADGSYATTKVISANVREGFGEVGLTSADNEPVLSKLEGQYLECRSEHNEISKDIAANAEAINGNATNFNEHISGESNKHTAKDIVCTDDWVNGENVQEAIDYLGEEKERIYALAYSNKTRLDNVEPRVANNETDIQSLQESVNANATDIGILRDDLMARPTADEERQAITDIENVGKRVDELNGAVEQANTWIADLDQVVEGNKTAADIALIDMEERSRNTFANALKGTASGEAIRIDDVSPVEHTLGVRVRSKNIVPVPYNFTGTSTSNYGTKATVNEDYSVTVRDVCTSNSVFTLKRFGAEPYRGKAVAIIPTDYSTRVYVHLYDKDGIAITYNWLVSSKITTGIVPDNAFYIEVGIAVLTTFTGEATTLYPCVMVGTSATDWKPYIDINAVKVKAFSKNFLDIPNYANASTATANFIIKDNTITIERIADSTASASSMVWDLGNYDSYIGKTLTVSCNLDALGGSDTNTLGAIVIMQGNPFGANPTTALVRTINLKVDDVGAKIAVPITIPEQTEKGKPLVVRLYLYNGKEIGDYLTISDLQVELGETSTEYEPYIAPVEYEVNADGTVNGVKSIYPNMTLYADANGALIDCEYNRDINKAFAEMANAIIALGGTI
ncbi:MAG: hypothetical protein IKW59_09145 [Clostridia bacterium]|nr:hypothetical protein [Clostridia bacterium]